MARHVNNILGSVILGRRMHKTTFVKISTKSASFEANLRHAETKASTSNWRAGELESWRA